MLLRAATPNVKLLEIVNFAHKFHGNLTKDAKTKSEINYSILCELIKYLCYIVTSGYKNNNNTKAIIEAKLINTNPHTIKSFGH